MVAREIENLCIRQLDNVASYEFLDAVAVESAATITVNGKKIATLACSPSNLQFLALGFLVSEGIVPGPGSIKEISVGEGTLPIEINVTADVLLPHFSAGALRIPSGCGRGDFFISRGPAAPVPVRSETALSRGQVWSLMRTFHRTANAYRQTGGMHGAALSDGKELPFFMEDIGRHNAVDKVLGGCMARKKPLRDHILLTTGRISSDLVLKAARAQLPIVISRAAPTTLAVKLACDLGITLVGFARGRRMNLYTHARRINGGESL